MNMSNAKSLLAGTLLATTLLALPAQAASLDTIERVYRECLRIDPFSVSYGPAGMKRWQRLIERGDNTLSGMAQYMLEAYHVRFKYQRGKPAVERHLAQVRRECRVVQYQGR